jgi:hypothetical protein
LSFKVDPTITTAGATIAPVVVEARDASNKLVPSFADSVTVTISRNPGNGTLTGTMTVLAIGGKATFSNLSIDRSGTGYRLQATSGALLSGPSARFDISAGPPTQLLFTVQPGTAAAGTAMAPALQVAAQDVLGNVATGFAGTVTLSITGGTGTAGASLSGQTTLAAQNGVATFTNVSVNKAGTGYTLSAASSGLPTTTSAVFDVIPGIAAQLVFTTQPSTTIAGTTITPAIQVTALDNLGNTATTFHNTVTVSITAGTGTFGASLSGTKTVLAVAGVATLSDLAINKSGAGYTLSADAAGLVGAVSAPFDMTAGAVTQITFTTQPTTSEAGTAITPPVQVSARDAAGNTVPSFTDTVTITLGVNPGSGTLTGTLKAAAVAGVASFADLRIDKVGVGYRLQAAAGAFGASSGAFSITPGPATQLVFAVQPVTTGAGAPITPPVQVEARDSLGNSATGFTGVVNVAIGTNPGGGTLTGTTTATAVAGVATFTTLIIDKLGAGYTLTAAASAGGITGTSSSPFDIIPGAATQLAFTVQPTTTIAGTAITPAVQVTARDALGNPATSYTGSVTVAIGTNPGGGGLSGTKTVSAVAGVASFSDLSIARVGSGYTLTVAAGGLVGATSGTFDILIGPVSRLVFTVQPASSPAGVIIAPAIVVAAQDAAGNTVPSFTDTVTMTIGVNPGSGTLSGTTKVAASAGVATFSDLSIDKIGTGYRLTASASGGSLTLNSSAFSISGGAATQLVFTAQPVSTGAGGIITPAVQVTAQDALGNTASGFVGSVVVAIGANPGGGLLAGTTTITATAGVATFSTLSIDRMGSGYTLTATATGLTGATSGLFNITAGVATQLVFSIQPSNTTAGESITPAVQATARDAQGNTATSFTGSVTVAIGTNPVAGTLSGTKIVTAVAGIATFSDLSINRNGSGYNLTAKASGLSTATSASFDILLGAVSQLVFTVQPTTASAGATIAPPIQVAAQDAAGNIVPSFTNPVTMTIGVNPGSGTLSGTVTVSAVAGLATFDDLSINKVGTGYRLVATAGSISNTSSAFSITGGPATHLVFTVPPSTTTAGAGITPAVKVAAQDALGNTATSFSGGITVVIGTNPSGGTLGGTTTLTAVLGVATFSNLSIDKVGSGYTLKASTSGFPTITSGAFDILPAPATKLAFTVQPTTTTAGVTISPAIKVTALDALGNPVPGFSGSVTVAIGTNPGTGTLSGTKIVPAVAGVATFSDLSINRNGTGYTLTASSSGLTGTTSSPFDILVGPVSQLVFTTQPVTTVATAAITPAVQVAARDAAGNTVPTFTSNVTMSIAVNPGTGILSGTKTVAAVSGVATFGNLNIDKVGTGYRLGATASALTVTSNAFSITPGAATKLLFTVQPTSTAAGAAISPAVEVTALDAGNNRATGFAGSVTMAIGTNPSSGTLSGTKTVTASTGVATFSNLSINNLGTGYTLRATSSGLSSATSVPFDIVIGSATQLAFTVQPVTTTAGATITPAVKVTARDAVGNTVSTFTGNVTVAIGNNPGTGSLSGTKTVAAVAGVATFSDLSINRNGTGYTLTASAAGLTGATSSAFNILVGPVVQLAFTAQPQTTTATTIFTPAVQVTARDSVGNTVTSFTGNVTMSIAVNPGTGTLAGTKVVAAVAGVATFSTLSIDKVGTGYRLGATAGALTGTSQAFSINPGAGTTLSFTVQPGTTSAGAVIAPAVEVTALDAGGNTATGFVGNVTMAIGTNPSSGTLSGTKIVAAVAGVATFADLSINNLGTGYTLRATATGLTAATSLPFNIVVGSATQLAFTVQPVTTTAGAAIPAVKVTARDAGGNAVSSFTGNVTVAIGTNPVGGTLSGTKTVAAVAGVATFSDLRIDRNGTGYTLTAASTGLTGATSNAFNINVGPVVALVFTTQPQTTTATTIFSPAVQVTAQDSVGNTVTSFTSNVTMSIAVNPSTGTLAGTKIVAAVAGVATFSTLSIDKVGVGYRLGATAGAVTGTSQAFSITAGTATHLIFTVQPVNTTAGAVITPAVEVTALDAGNNTATGFVGNVTVAIGTNPGGPSTVLSGTKIVAAFSGVASFSTLSINNVGNGYTLTATGVGPTATSGAFNITP